MYLFHHWEVTAAQRDVPCLQEPVAEASLRAKGEEDQN